MIAAVLWAAAGVILSGALWRLFFARREKQLLDRLQRMIDQAAAGSLDRTEISETKLSALENSLKRYLDASLLANENQKKQKEIIQGLISDISHQTLTPIANLNLYTELLQEELGRPSETVSTIREQAQKLDFLIRSLVKLSRMESGIIAVHPKNTKLSALFALLGQEYGPKAAEKSIALSLGDTALSARFDLKWTAEALGNLVDNAVKYTPEGRQIVITAEHYSFFTRIDIADTGIGIAEEEIPKVFSRFYRSFSVADQPGVGIGLYLAREILQAQGGYIKAASRKGAGSVFSVFLPR